MGSSCSVLDRWSAHRRKLRKGVHHSIHLQRAWDKYGEVAFLFTMLITVEEDRLRSTEQEVLDWYRPRYNVSRLSTGFAPGVPRPWSSDRRATSATRSRAYWAEIAAGGVHPKSRIRLGAVFGDLEVTACIGRQKGQVYWRLRCVCGESCTVTSTNLLNDSTRTCGCRRGERIAQSKRTHGRTGTPEHKAWVSMRRLHRAAICAEWKSFDQFLSDMGLRPAGFRLGRLDPQAAFNASNCRWMTSRDLNRRRTDTVTLCVNGVSKPLSAWAEECDIDRVLLWIRVHRLGWSHERAVCTPVRKKGACLREEQHGGRLVQGRS